MKDAYSNDNSLIHWDLNHTNLKYMSDAIHYLEYRLNQSSKTPSGMSYRIETYSPKSPEVKEIRSDDYPDHPDFKYIDVRNYVDIKIYSYYNGKFQLRNCLEWNATNFEFKPSLKSSTDNYEFVNYICEELNYIFNDLKEYKLDENLEYSVEIMKDGTIHTVFKYIYITPIEDNRSELARLMGFPSPVTQAAPSDKDIRRYGLKGYLAKKFKDVLTDPDNSRYIKDIDALNELYKTNPIAILNYSGRMKDIIDKDEFEYLLDEFKKGLYTKDKLNLSNDEIYNYTSLKERAKDINNEKAWITVWYKIDKNILKRL